MSQIIAKEKNYHTDNKSFMFYKDWEQYFNMLSDSEIAALVKALFAFAAREEKVQLEGMSAMAYKFMISAIERDGRKWEQTCINRSNRKSGRTCAGSDKTEEKSENQSKENSEDKSDSENPKQSKETKSTQKLSKEPDTDKDKDKETEKDIDIEKDKETEKVRYYGKYRNVALTESQLNSLVMSSSSSHTDKYIEKLSKWLKRRNKSCEDCYSVISQWIEEDRESSEVSESPHTEDLSYSGTSYDLDEFERYALNFSLSKKNNWDRETAP